MASTGKRGTDSRPSPQRSRNDLREADFNGVFSAAIEKPPKAFTAILD